MKNNIQTVDAYRWAIVFVRNISALFELFYIQISKWSIMWLYKGNMNNEKAK